jgi:hypothetical protein
MAMDADRFDAIARRLGAQSTRRSALGGLIGAGLTGAATTIGAGKNRSGKKGQKRRDKRRRPRPQGKCANPGPSRNLNGCDFAGKDFSGQNLSGSEINDASFNNAELVGADLSDSSMRRTSFRGANLCRATLTSASLNKADFRGADGSQGRPTNLTLADLRSATCGGVQFDANTIFCGTRMCNGVIRNDDCPAGVDPTHACCADADCGPNRICRNGACVPDPGTCTTGQNFCQNTRTASCDDRLGCDCFVTASGTSFCGLSGFCSNCSRDDDCVSVTGPGSACVDTTGDSCGCDGFANRACVRPCGQCANDAQCGVARVCCGGECKTGDCCTTADCGADERCERNRCTCEGCRTGHTCSVGTAWAQCGDDGKQCQACAQGEVCADRQTCATCETHPSPGGETWCDAVHHFAPFQCGSNCSCAQPRFGFNGVCFDRGVAGYCLRDDVICTSNADCVRERYGNRCVAAGNCEEAAHCYQAVCVTECGGSPPHGNTDAGDGSLQVVVFDE